MLAPPPLRAGLTRPGRNAVPPTVAHPTRQRASSRSVGTRVAAGDPAAAAAAAAAAAQRVRVPASIHEVDNGKVLGFGPNLSVDHPGFADEAYKTRRLNICNSARAHVIGDPIPHVDYTLEEVAVWGLVLRALQGMYPRHACAEFLRCWHLFGFREDAVPQLEDVSQVLQAATGWQLRPVAGLLHPRDFLAGLAFKTFHSTQYVRHASRPSYTPEPDVCHELLGHMPMLADPYYCSLAEAIGRASLGADDKAIWALTKVYWYTIEFGVVREGNAIKAFGAGILSSPGELAHMAAGGAALAPFDPFSPLPKMSYKDGYQQRYFVLDSFQDGAARLRAYCDTLRLPESLRGDPRSA